MNSSTKEFFSKCDQIRSFLWIWLLLLKKSLIENFAFCAVSEAAFAGVLQQNYFENLKKLHKKILVAESYFIKSAD